MAHWREALPNPIMTVQLQDWVEDFAGTLLGFIRQILSCPRAPRPHVTFDFWHQFDAAEELEALRLYRPAIYKALPERKQRISPWS